LVCSSWAGWRHDAKLFAATTLWLGHEVLLTYGVITALIGGALTLGLLFWRGVPLPATLTSQGWLVRLHSAKEGVPYGIALAAAGLLVYPQTPFMAALGG
jgi:prepilin peptidase CpaA